MLTAAFLFFWLNDPTYWQRALSPDNLPNWVLGLVGTLAAVFTWRTLRAIEIQVEAGIDAERAWVMAEVKGKVHLFMGTTKGVETTAVNAVLVCTNQGKTPAWIQEKHVRLAIVTSPPADPTMGLEPFEMVPEPLAVGAQSTSKLNGIHCVGQKKADDGKMLILYGLVKYRDMFNRIRQTNFGYIINETGEAVRLMHPKYNMNN